MFFPNLVPKVAAAATTAATANNNPNIQVNKQKIYPHSMQVSNINIYFIVQVIFICSLESSNDILKIQLW